MQTQLLNELVRYWTTKKPVSRYSMAPPLQQYRRDPIIWPQNTEIWEQMRTCRISAQKGQNICVKNGGRVRSMHTMHNKMSEHLHTCTQNICTHAHKHWTMHTSNKQDHRQPRAQINHMKNISRKRYNFYEGHGWEEPQNYKNDRCKQLMKNPIVSRIFNHLCTYAHIHIRNQN